MRLVIAFVAVVSAAAGQQAALTVCQTLDSVRHHQEVTIRAQVSGSFRHGFGLSQGIDGEPCPGWPRRFFTAPSVILPAFESYGGVQIPTEERRSNLNFLQWLLVNSRRSGLNHCTVTLTGVLVRKHWWSFIGRAPDGDYVGYGLGPSGGYAAALVITAIIDVSNR